MTTFSERTIKSESIYKGKIIDVSIATIEREDGERAKRELVKHPGAVAIIAVTDENKLVLVEQYRKALEKPIIEIPAGKIEVGEEPIKTAYRELKEETGYSTTRLTEIASFYTSPGFADEIVYLYEASSLEEGEQQLDDGEYVHVVTKSLAECEELIKEQRIHDAKTMYAIQYLKLKEN
ncbi:NUDIX hydrolase [Shouchella lehensis]|uniref:ADP-ribose pyrophosphatase n=2 Tax=Shouchella lehensis TaxID=300825 RepID=A0A060LSE0_9BACI|nr:NUDIX hydrolase [Shouchella lehensis]AIC94171.1 ADP-ribose pyrophosphatase [Shouchella lehensis G1]MBG9785792.1 ADP-ribose pyrophosphatase [Shouchella lehensis]RQW20083.1 NUDIX hydrolase [Bacillus sp. C1-1]TES48261.1 NUDIX hydrolase [Shouchella lehensis]